MAVPAQRNRVETATWVGLLLPPLAWSAYVFVAWFLVPVACDADVGFVLHLFAAASLALAAAGLAVSLRTFRRGNEQGWEDAPGMGVGRLLPSVALLLGLLFTVGLVLLWLFTIFISPCERG